MSVCVLGKMLWKWKNTVKTSVYTEGTCRLMTQTGRQTAWEKGLATVKFLCYFPRKSWVCQSGSHSLLHHLRLWNIENRIDVRLPETRHKTRIFRSGSPLGAFSERLQNLLDSQTFKGPVCCLGWRRQFSLLAFVSAKCIYPLTSQQGILFVFM